MSIQVIEEVGDFMRYIKTYSEIPTERIYRGQNQDWELLPSLYRNDRKRNNLRIELELIKRLILNKPILPTGLEDYFDFLIFAQQHSMPTRLLDWTYSPLIALWFACNNKNNDFKNDGFIYSIDCSSLPNARFDNNEYNKSGLEFKSHLDNLAELKKLIPSPLFARLESQNGIFTVFPNEYEIQEDIILKFKIPKNRKVPILKELGKLNINEYTIFKDNDSLCRTLYWEIYSKKILYKDEEVPPPYIDFW